MSGIAAFLRIVSQPSCRAFIAATLFIALGLAPLLPARAQSDTQPSLQSRLRATDEEWSILLPKLARIAALQDEVTAIAGDASNDRPAFMRRFLDSPLGGTSMDVPVMPNSGIRTVVTALGLVSRPFDPANAPGAATRPSSDDTGRRLGRAMVGRIKTNQGNSVQTLLNDLQTLLDAKDTTDAQLRDKLAEVRAARAQATRDLAAAEADLAPLLTTDQLATLVDLGYLD